MTKCRFRFVAIILGLSLPLVLSTPARADGLGAAIGQKVRGVVDSAAKKVNQVRDYQKVYRNSLVTSPIVPSSGKFTAVGDLVYGVLAANMVRQGISFGALGAPVVAPLATLLAASPASRLGFANADPNQPKRGAIAWGARRVVGAAAALNLPTMAAVWEVKNTSNWVHGLLAKFRHQPVQNKLAPTSFKDFLLSAGK
jgi:hypothetical protein